MKKKNEKIVHIVDDDEAVRDSIRELVESVDLVAQTYGSAEEFLDTAEPKKPACLVLDVRMAGMSGLTLQEHLKEQCFDFPIIVITGHGDIPMAVESVQKGAIDFIEKPYRDQHLLDSINQALLTSEGSADSRPGQGLVDLTDRELEIYRRVLDGETSKTIARDLGVSPRTIETHRRNILQKLGVASVKDLMLAVLDRGE